MFIGDSITNGGPWYADEFGGGYRGRLVRNLTGIFPVGALTNDCPAPISLIDGSPLSFAKIQHEGHTGQQTSYFVTNIATIWAANPAQRALIHLGTNDAYIGQGTVTPAQTAANLATIVDYIHSQSTDTRCWVAGIINAKSTQVVANALIDATRPLVQSMCLHRQLCTYVPMPHFSDALIADDVHPSDAGKDLMAATWLTALQEA